MSEETALTTLPTEQLRAELAQISAQLDTYAFRRENKRIYALLESEEGKQLSREAREHLTDRTMRNVFDAVNADPEVERLFLREHEIELILRRREHADLFTISTTGEFVIDEDDDD